MLNFKSELLSGGVRIIGNKANTVVLPERWMSEASDAQQPTVTHLLTMLDAGEAEAEKGGALFLSNDIAVNLPERAAIAADMPPRSTYALNVQHQGVINGQDGFQIHCRLTNSYGQPVISERRGAFVRTGTRWWRLPCSHFRLMDAAERINNTLATGDTDERLRAYATLREFLPEEGAEGIHAAPLLRQFQVYDAAAFSLRLRIEKGRLKFDPVLYARKPAERNEPDDASQDDLAPLLPNASMEVFAGLLGENTSRYILGGNRCIVLSNDLTKAMNTVKRLRDGADTAALQRFFLNPTAVLREEFAQDLGDEGLDEMLDSLFLETSSYLSDRVKGIGIWKKPVLPWITKKGNDWFPPEEEGETPNRGIRIDSPNGPIDLPLASQEAAAMRGEVEGAIERGEDFIEHKGHRIPANTDTLSALDELCNPKRRVPPQNPESRFALLIDGNYEADTHRRGLQQRGTRDDALLPTGLRAQLKQHQLEGLRWMQEAWRGGMPGVLLADDMGLGKTLQVLSFLLWLKQNTTTRPDANAGGLLIVAPTALLGTWKDEHDRHLEEPGLGALVQAHGSGLRSLRCADGNGLDQELLRKADWILTTYETMKGYQTAFAAINFAAIVFDEAQKIKAPDAQVTDAAKALNGQFKIAMTGTPVENRRADLWCLADAVYPGLLGSLKDFSQAYEKNETVESVQRLKSIITSRDVQISPREFMMRRMKEQILDGLPKKGEVPLDETSANMPPAQADAYKAILTNSRGAASQGAKLKAIQEMRLVSLHPRMDDEPAVDAIDAFINDSARIKMACEILGKIKQRDEKALLFVHSRSMQDWMRLILARKFNLPAVKVINGTTPSATRNKIVSEFQTAGPGFSALMLSPKAGGVGFTITAANHVIHLERWWNPAVEDQCTDRVYRIGQKRDVTVWLPLAVHPDPAIAGHSFDLKLHNLLNRKRQMSRELLCGIHDLDADTSALFEETVASAS